MSSHRVQLDGDNTIDLDMLKTFAFQVAGSVSAVFLMKHPQEVLPTQEVAAAVYTIIANFDFKDLEPWPQTLSS